MSDEMARFAASFANEGLAGLKIEGFGDNDPIPPSFAPDDFAPVANEIPAPDSPLRAIVQRPVNAPAKPEEPKPTSALFVIDRNAGFEGQTVELSDREMRDVAQIVLKAIVKRAREQYEKVASQVVKRTYTRRKHAEAGPRDEGGVRSGDPGRKGGGGLRKGRRPRPAVQGGEGGGTDPAPAGEAGSGA